METHNTASAPYRRSFGPVQTSGGVRFSVFSSAAERIELCFFEIDKSGTKEVGRVPMALAEGGVWTVEVPGVQEGRLYGYRAHGPWDPEKGLFFNPAKVLVDPYATSVGRVPVWNDSLFGYEGEMATRSSVDNLQFAGLSAVAFDRFDWGNDRAPNVPWEKTVVYEAHVKGLTHLHPGVPEAYRGKYLGMCSEPVIEHLKSIGVTTVELLPVHQHFVERSVARRGMVNYWGYMTLSYFAPDLRYGSSPNPLDVIDEFKTMVRTLHRAGIEVILDVVYNHTCEGDPTGPLLSLRGLDNKTYYRIQPDDPSKYVDFTGCGNTLDLREPRVLQLVLDSLRYWVTEMHVDGFRFDLTSALVRGESEVDLKCAFLAAVAQDPVLSRVKLIAEPWDCAWGSYQVGNFPPPWRDWNGRFRDTARLFWRGEGGKLGELASRLSGSSDMFGGKQRSATATVNFITAHDGYTLHDVVSYEQKHNEANGEENRDGDNSNFGRNWGVEGVTRDQAVLETRERVKRSLLSTLYFSVGVPMITAGDELSRTQNGNNNAYCHDSELVWVNWQLDERQKQFLEFVKGLGRLRNIEPGLARTEFFTGNQMPGSDARDVTWLDRHAQPMPIETWQNGEERVLAMMFYPERSARERTKAGRALLLVVNGSHEHLHFPLKVLPESSEWELLSDSGSGYVRPAGEASGRSAGGSFELMSHSAALFRAK